MRHAVVRLDFRNGVLLGLSWGKLPSEMRRTYFLHFLLGCIEFGPYAPLGAPGWRLW